MKLLPDTHAVLWLMEDNPALSKRARVLLESGRHEVLISAVVAWEIALKSSLGKLDVIGDPIALMLSGGAVELPITIEHAVAVKTLPLHHNDPFDRLLIAQAHVENAVVLSVDTAFDAYGVRRRW